MRVGPSMHYRTADVKAENVESPVRVWTPDSDPDVQPGRLWLPPSLRPPPPPGSRPRIWIPDTYARPRTNEEHAYYRKLIEEVRADLNKRHEEGRQRIESALAQRRLGEVRKEEAVEGGGASRPERYVEEDGQTAVVVTDPDEVDAAIVAAANKAPVPHRKQKGPTCGLYAVGMVMDHWHERDAKNPTFLVQDSDIELQDGYKYFNYEPTDDRRLLDVALANGYTAKGEMYHGKYTAQIAADFGYKAGLHRNSTLEDVYDVLDAKHPIVVCYDNTDTGYPGKSGGHRAHYAVLQSYFDFQGERYLIVKHSNRRSTDRVWRACDFFDSWSQMLTTACYGNPGDGKMGKWPELDEPSGLDLPPAGEGLASIKESLANVMIEIVPPDEELVGGEVFAPQA